MLKSAFSLYKEQIFIEGLLGDYDFSMSRVIERIMNHGKRPEDFAPVAAVAEAATPAAASVAVPAAAPGKETGKEANDHE